MTFLTVDQKKTFDSHKTIFLKAKHLQSLYFNFIHYEEDVKEAGQANSITIEISDDSAVLFRDSDNRQDRSGIYSYMNQKHCHCLYCGDKLNPKKNDSLYLSAETHSCNFRKSIEIVSDEWRTNLADMDHVSNKVHSLIARLKKCEINDRDAEFVRAFVADTYHQSKVVFGADSIETIDNMIQCSLDAMIVLSTSKNSQLSKVLSYCEDILGVCGVVYAPMNDEEAALTRREFEAYLDQSKREVTGGSMKEENSNRHLKLIQGGMTENTDKPAPEVKAQRERPQASEQVLYRGFDDDTFEVVATYNAR